MIKRYDSIVEHVAPDPWKNLRQEMNLFMAREPSVELIAITRPLKKLERLGVTTETIPAYTARHCHDSHKNYGKNSEKNRELDIDLTKRLILQEHGTPLQATTYVFDFNGVSKALQTHWTRHKVGVGWSFVSTRYDDVSKKGFVYNTYHYIKDKDDVVKLLRRNEERNKRAVNDYLTSRESNVRREDARKDFPLSVSNHGSFFGNARAIRTIFNLRLHKRAEWEIRRLCGLMLDELMMETPILFEDIYLKHLGKMGSQKK